MARPNPGSAIHGRQAKAGCNLEMGERTIRPLLVIGGATLASYDSARTAGRAVARAHASRP